MVLEAGRRNRNFKVLRSSGCGLFLKQVKSVNSIENSTLKREANCYLVAQKYNEWAAVMPSFVDHDTKRQCLTLELVPNGVNLSDYHRGFARLPTVVGKLVGTALGCFHRVTRGEVLHTDEATFFPKRIPWILFFHRDNNRVSGGVIQLGDQIRANLFLSESMDRLYQQWRFDGVVHGDMKWDNCVIYTSAQGEQELKIIDWELLDYGDASWDVAGFFHSYLTHWISSMPFSDDMAPTRLIEDAKTTLDKVIPAMQKFWDSYLDASGLPHLQAASFLLRAIEHTAARLLQTAFEALYYTAAMTNQTKVLVQLSENILRDPVLAAREYFGLNVEGAECRQH